MKQTPVRVLQTNVQPLFSVYFSSIIINEVRDSGSLLCNILSIILARSFNRLVEVVALLLPPPAFKQFVETV